MLTTKKWWGPVGGDEAMRTLGLKPGTFCDECGMCLDDHDVWVPIVDDGLDWSGADFECPWICPFSSSWCERDDPCKACQQDHWDEDAYDWEK
jgi:hypothetical protein